MEKSWGKVGKKSWGTKKIFIFSTFSFQLITKISEGAQVSKVTLCVKILKWHSVTAQGQVRAARAAKDTMMSSNSRVN